MKNSSDMSQSFIARTKRAIPVVCTESGAAYIEFILFFPVILLLLGLIIFWTHLYSAKVNVAAAVNTVRFAHTRASYGYLTDIDDARTGISPGDWPAPWLASLSQKNNAEALYLNKFNWVYAPTSSFSGGEWIDRDNGIPDTVYYAMAYAYAQLRGSISEDLEYPCEHAGCAFCYPHHPIPAVNSNTTFPPFGAGPVPTPTPHPINYDPGAYSAPALPPVHISATDFDRNFTGIVCDYYVSSIFVDIAAAGAALIGTPLPPHLYRVRKSNWYWSSDR